MSSTDKALLESSLNNDLDEPQEVPHKEVGVFKSLTLPMKIFLFGILVVCISSIILFIYFLSKSPSSSVTPNKDPIVPDSKNEGSSENSGSNSDSTTSSNSSEYTPLPGCQIYSSCTCPSAAGDMLPDWEDHLWNTPHPGDAEYQPSFQHYYVLQGYAQLRYASDLKSCTVNIYTKTGADLKLWYYFDGIKQASSSKTFDTSYTRQLKVKVVAETNEYLELEEIDFIWNTAIPLPDRDGDFRNGKKGAIVELFGWPDDQIEKECKVIAEAGYLGVKLFPHQEQLMAWQPMENMLNPWYFMYQPVSYSLNGRMGNRSTLRHMIKTCRSYGLRVYADAVVNHMTGSGNDMSWHRNPGASCTYWPPKTSSGEFANRTNPYYTPAYTYQINPHTQRGTNVLEFPGVPYGPMDFHCDKACNAWTDPNNLNTGWLTGLTDLDTSKDYVRQRIADYMVDLLSIGFTGFRVDAAKHIHPDDLAVIFGKFKAAMGGSYPVDFFTWLEVLTGGEGELLVRDSDYSFTTHLTSKLQEQGLTDTEIDQIKLWWAPYPVEPDLDQHRLSRTRKVIQNDDHDQQSSGSSSRDMHDQGSVLVKDKNPDKHRKFEIKLFEDPYGNGDVDNDNDYPIRMVLSSYYFTKDENNQVISSPPDGYSDCKLCKTTCDYCKSREYAPAYVENAKAYEGTDYTRVHRDEQIIAAMHEWMHIA